MWAIRKTSFGIKFQTFLSVTTLHAFNAKFETSSSSYTYNTVFSALPPPPHISDSSITLKRIYSQNYPFIGKHSFSSEAGTKSSGEEEDDFSELDLSDIDEDEAAEGNNHHHAGKASSGLFNAIINSPLISVKESANKWLEEGNDLSKEEISIAMYKFRRRKMYRKAFELSEWVEAQGKVEIGQRDYAFRVNLVAKLWGPQKAENYIEKNIPESFRGVSVYEALLANCVVNTNNTTKAEQVFNNIQNLKLPLTIFACNQMLLLYKRTDRRKMANVFLLMEKENIKPSVFTYRLLLDIRGQYGHLDRMEEIVEKMKGEGLEPDLGFQVVLAKHYVELGITEKAKAVLKEMEGGGHLDENRGVCSYLLPLYASLGSLDDVKKVWAVCETDPQIHECMRAIDAFGKLKKVEEAEAVFDKMAKKHKQLRAKHYTAMLKVYAYNKMFSEGKSVVKRINESGFGIVPESLDALVRFYIEAGKIEEAGGLILNTPSPRRIKGKPFLSTYKMMLEEYAKRGDVDNAEMIFMRMREDGYDLKHRPYKSLMRAYRNAKIPVYGWFRKRLESDGIIPSKSMEVQLDRVDAYKKTAVSHELD